MIGSGTAAHQAASTAAPLLEVKDLKVAYAGVLALHGVSLQLRPDEVVAVVGSNGAGKSTLLRAISGIVPAQAGSVRFGETELLGMPAHRVTAAGVVQVPEGRSLFGRMTVEDNLMLVAAIHGERKHEEVRAVLQRFPALLPRLKQLAGTLSGGEQAMVAFARALLARPRVLLLDEPSLGMAPRIVAEVMQQVQNVRAQGTPVLLVEQRVQDALRVASRAYVLQTGRIVASGPAQELAHSDLIRKAYLGL